MLSAVSRQLLRHSRQATCVAATQTRNKFTLPELPYKYNALEPVISGEIMELHHSKHHATYVNNLNAAEEKLKQAIEDGNIKGILDTQGAIKFNGGGHLNHSIFWTHLSPNGGGKPTGDLAAAIDRDFGSFDNFMDQMTTKTVAIQGSGWGWLGYSKSNGRLVISTTANQDPLQATTGLIPLLGIDVWEHAYYLQYKNVRPEYVKAIWKVMDWKDIESKFSAAKSS